MQTGWTELAASGILLGDQWRNAYWLDKSRYQMVLSGKHWRNGSRLNKISGNWYYLASSGAMQTGRLG